MNLRRNLGVETILLILVVTFENAASYPDYHPRAKRFEENSDNNLGTGNPLLLTPLLEAKQADSARSRAKVTHPQMLNVESYAGYFTVNKISNSNLFFWYFPAKENSANAPLVLFLEGGPGMSSLFSLFLENGPFVVTPDESLKMRKESWNNKHNVIYIDNPVGSGYSFTDSDHGYATTQTQITDELRIALLQFFQLFPSLRKNDFFVTGVSYAGKFVPAISYSIHLYNAHAEQDKKINLKGMAIASGFTDPANQLIYGKHLYEIGLVDANGRDQFLVLEKKARDLILNNQYTAAYDVKGQLILSENSLFHNLTGYYDSYNIVQTNFGEDIDNPFSWVERDDVRRALHVGNQSFIPYSEKVGRLLQGDDTQSLANTVAALLDHYRILLYTGNLDMLCSYPSLQNYLRKLAWSHAEEYKTVERKQWRVASGQLAGYIKKVGKLTEVLVRNAGHYISFDQPQWTLELLEKFTAGSL